MIVYVRVCLPLRFRRSGHFTGAQKRGISILGVQKAWLAGLQVGRWGRVAVRGTFDGALRGELFVSRSSDGSKS